ncbi:MAG TPA: OmpA family protein [Lamprocystis sp. (in: g-proteobacteria)]|nr:OmpA family protein [Lamprocystis sp. (in: g-proteobacteria)]
MNRKPLSVLSTTGLAALVLAAPLAAVAQTDYQSKAPRFDDRWYVVPFASWTDADSNRGTDDGFGGGLAIGKPLNERFNLELRATYTNLASKQDLGGDFEVGDVGIDGLFFFSRGRVQPFLLAGIGAINDKFNCNLAEVNIGTCQSGNEWSFMAEVGAGVIVPITEYVSFRLDGRYRYDYNSGNLNGNLDGHEIRDLNGAWEGDWNGDWNNNGDAFGDWVVTAGIYIPIGSRAAPVTKTFELSADALFAFDKYQLKPTGVNTLNRFASDLNQANYSDIRVAGHTDPIGSEEYNLALSDRRANAVREHLVGQGVAADHITAQGFGKSQLKVTPEDCAGTNSREALIECYQPNRRVDVTVEGMTAK